MIDAMEVQRLLGWLRQRGADPAVVSFVTNELGGPDTGIPEDLGWEDCALVLEGLLILACEPRVDERALDRLLGVAVRLGYDEDAIGHLVRERLGITERRLRAYAVLGLPLDARPDEIKATHRAIAKAYHPDRLSTADAEARATAERLLGRLNHARAVLLSPRDEVVLDRPDDVPLGDPWFEPEDAPTETDLEDGLTDQLEQVM